MHDFRGECHHAGLGESSDHQRPRGAGEEAQQGGMRRRSILVLQPPGQERDQDRGECPTAHIDGPQCTHSQKIGPPSAMDDGPNDR